MQNKVRHSLFAVIILLLSACGEPSIIAYTRGQYFQRKAQSESARHRDYLPDIAKSDYASAIDQFSAALKLNPHYYYAALERGVCYEALRNDKAALKDFSEAIAVNPKSFEPWQRRARIDDRLGDFEHAIDDLSQAIKLSPANRKENHLLELYLARASSETDANRLDDAMKDCEYVLSKKPEWAAAVLQRATTRWVMGKRKESNDDFARVIQLSPHWPLAYQVRGYYEFIASDYKSAVTDLEKSLQLTQEWDAEEPLYAVIFASQAYRLQKNPKEANNLLESCTERTQLPVATADGAENAEIAEHWPAPAVQFFRRDIGSTQLLRAAGNDQNKLTEVHCYIGLDEIANGRNAEAKPHFDWVLTNGNRGFVEYQIAKELSKKS